MRKRWILWACCLGVLAGCGVGPIYDDSSRSDAAAISARPTWSAMGDLASPQNSIDGDINTIAVSTESYGNAAVTIDLAKPCMFNMVVIDHGRNEYGFCRKVAVLTSMDGKKFVRRHTASGTRRVTILCLRAPVLARYLRLQAVVQSEQRWSLAEIYLQ